VRSIEGHRRKATSDRVLPVYVEETGLGPSLWMPFPGCTHPRNAVGWGKALLCVKADTAAETLTTDDPRSNCGARGGYLEMCVAAYLAR